MTRGGSGSERERGGKERERGEGEGDIVELSSDDDSWQLQL